MPAPTGTDESGYLSESPDKVKQMQVLPIQIKWLDIYERAVLRLIGGADTGQGLIEIFRRDVVAEIRYRRQFKN